MKESRFYRQHILVFYPCTIGKCCTIRSPQCIQQSLHTVGRLFFQHLDAALHLQTHTHTCMQKHSFKRKVTPFCPSPLTVIMDTHPHTQSDGKAEYSAAFHQSSVLHNPSEIIIMCWFVFLCFDNNGYFFQCWKQICCLIFLRKPRDTPLYVKTFIMLQKTCIANNTVQNWK